MDGFGPHVTSKEPNYEGSGRLPHLLRASSIISCEVFGGDGVRGGGVWRSGSATGSAEGAGLSGREGADGGADAGLVGVAGDAAGDSAGDLEVLKGRSTG